MMNIRRSNERGYADHGWLKSFHTFSFAGYRDTNHMEFRSLRVMNEDRVAPGKGFGTHAHDNMEIVSYVLEGELEHEDSIGNGEVLRPGEFQHITAGTGITHSEFNPSSSHSTHFYQIWIRPDRKDIEPSYEQRTFDAAERQNTLQLVASHDAQNGSLLIHQDVQIFLADLTNGNELAYEVQSERHVWLQVLRGSLSINGETLKTGDAASISDKAQLTLKSNEAAELMLFDLA